MNAIGHCLMGKSLDVSIPNAHWGFSIRRVDGKPYKPFMSLTDKEVLPSDVAEFLPNWERLKWSEIDDAFLLKGAYYAEDQDFRITIQITAGNGMTEAEALSAFSEFMSQAQGTK